MKSRKFIVKYKNPILPMYENTEISLEDILVEIAVGKTAHTLSATLEAIDDGIRIDSCHRTLAVAKPGAYRLAVHYPDTTKTVVVIAIPKTVTEKQYEATVFEYDFKGKTFGDISRYWVLQMRPDTLTTFSVPSAPQVSATKNTTDGFVPFAAGYSDQNGNIKYNPTNALKGIGNVGFMYLKADNIPCLLSDYTVYTDGVLLNAAPNIPGDNKPSGTAAAGIVGRITLSNDGVIDYTSTYQALLSTIMDHAAYKIGSNSAHRSFYLSDKIFLGWEYNSHSDQYYGTDNSGIKIGDPYSLLARFNGSTITTGIKKGLISDKGDFSLRSINKDCYHENNPFNFTLENPKDKYIASDCGLCIKNTGSVGFVYNGAETALDTFRVTYTVDTENMPEGIDCNFTPAQSKRELPPPEIPVRTKQKPLNVFGGSYGKTDEQNNRHIKFTVLADQHYDYYSYDENKNNYVGCRTNFLKALNESDSEFVIMPGDNVRWALNYTTHDLIEAGLHQRVFYKFLSHAPDKDFFVFQGNHDYCTSEYPDRFVLETNAATFICFRCEYVEFSKDVGDVGIPSAGLVTKETLEWLKQCCDAAVRKNPDVLLIFVNHFSCQNNPEKFKGAMKDDGDIKLAQKNIESLGRNELLDIITQYGVKLYINGHEHNNGMNYEEITYEHGYKTGCINYSAGLSPTDCLIDEYNNNHQKQIDVVMKQYSYNSFYSIPEDMEKTVAKTVTFPLINTCTKCDRAFTAQSFYKAKQVLENIYSGRFDGLYKYCFEYIGSKQKDNKKYFGFNVSYLRYYICNCGAPTTVYADPDNDTMHSNLKTHIADVYISDSGEIL